MAALNSWISFGGSLANIAGSTYNGGAFSGLRSTFKAAYDAYQRGINSQAIDQNLTDIQDRARDTLTDRVTNFPNTHNDLDELASNYDGETSTDTNPTQTMDGIQYESFEDLIERRRAEEEQTSSPGDADMQNRDPGGDGDDPNDPGHPDDEEPHHPDCDDDLPDDAPFEEPPRRDPLVIDLDGDGIELTALEGSQTFFDLNVDGFAERTAFVAPDDGLLAYDANGNGIIDDNTELFGDAAGFENGFAQLAQFDTNQDGIISAADDDFSSLVVWRDLDQDGFSDAGELQSLSDVGISSIDLNASEISETNAGNTVTHRSTVTFDDGRTSNIEDVLFQSDLSSSQAILSEGFEYAQDARILPTLWGYGNIASTWVQLSVDSDLNAESHELLVQLEQGNISGFIESFESFVLNWAGVSDVDISSRGNYINAQHLIFL